MVFKVKDHYYEKAKKENFLARSVYKLDEIDKKFSVIKKNDIVVDLGYYPGSWIQYTSAKIGPTGKIVGIDIKEINKKLLHLGNVELFSRDIFDISTLRQLNVDDKFDVLLSDMAPNTTGIRSVDQDRSYNLVEMVFHLMPVFLKKNGNMVIKVFDGNQVQIFLKENRSLFRQFKFLRPKSTRSVSKEFFVIGCGYGA